jgi:hypothetical protein
MKRRLVTRIGDLFCVPLSEEKKKFFQLVAFDPTQLNSDVIRVFKKEYPLDADPDVKEIVAGEVDFYAHCVTKSGVSLGVWKKLGKSDDIGNISHILFRDTNDYGEKERIEISDKWYVWHIGDSDFTRVGKLEGENRNAEIGLVINPASIVHRMQTGEYNLPWYPGFE